MGRARKLFSPRTVALIRTRTGEKFGTSTPSPKHNGSEWRKNQTVSVQIRGTLCVGVSKKLRTEYWQSILERPGLHQDAKAAYAALLTQDVSQSVAESIDKDVGRTFPGVAFFCSGTGQQSMKNVLLAYAVYDTDVGYCQGMNFLAGMLLLNLPSEDDAFAALVMLMHERGLRDLYTQDMSLLEVRLYQLTQLIPISLTRHLESFGALPVLFASSWFLTCFAAAFPLDLATRILDVVLNGSFDAFMLKVSYTLLVTHRKHLMALSSMEDILEFLTSTLPNSDLRDVQNIVTEATRLRWSAEHQSIVDNTKKIESVYDTVTRVEDKLSSSSSLSTSTTSTTTEITATNTFDTDEDSTPRFKRHQQIRKSFTSIALFLPHALVSNIKLKQHLHHIHVPVQSFMRKFR